MPLRDHFPSPPGDRFSTDGLLGGWPAVIVIDLNRRLPERYVASPRVNLGRRFDVGERPLNEPALADHSWIPPGPTLSTNAALPDVNEYAVRVYDEGLQRLAAVVEIVSPANKDRPEHRRQFATKCAALLQRGVSVAIVDVVTDRRGNLYAEVLELFDRSDPTMGETPPSQYAVELRPHVRSPSSRLETWAYPLAVGRPLPRLPLWIAEDLAVPLELEATYEETCRALRIA